MTLEHFKIIISIVQVVLVPLFMAGLSYLNRIRTSVETTRVDLQEQIEKAREDLRKELHEIGSEVRKTNGRIGSLESWRVTHDHVDDQREERASRAIDTVREDIRHLQTTILSGRAATA